MSVTDVQGAKEESSCSPLVLPSVSSAGRIAPCKPIFPWAHGAGPAAAVSAHVPVGSLDSDPFSASHSNNHVQGGGLYTLWQRVSCPMRLLQACVLCNGAWLWMDSGSNIRCSVRSRQVGSPSTTARWRLGLLIRQCLALSLSCPMKKGLEWLMSRNEEGRPVLEINR